jgi:hypothetical protein
VVESLVEQIATAVPKRVMSISKSEDIMNNANLPLFSESKECVPSPFLLLLGIFVVPLGIFELRLYT